MESLSEQAAKCSRTSCQAILSPLDFHTPTHPAARCPKLATYKAQHGGKGYPLWSAGAHDQGTLSGTADWENVAGPCSAFLLQEIYERDTTHHQHGFLKTEQPESHARESHMKPFYQLLSVISRTHFRFSSAGEKVSKNVMKTKQHRNSINLGVPFHLILEG